jgi:hypothetical protein
MVSGISMPKEKVCKKKIKGKKNSAGHLYVLIRTFFPVVAKVHELIPGRESPEDRART